MGLSDVRMCRVNTPDTRLTASDSEHELPLPLPRLTQHPRRIQDPPHDHRLRALARRPRVHRCRFRRRCCYDGHDVSLQRRGRGRHRDLRRRDDSKRLSHWDAQRPTRSISDTCSCTPTARPRLGTVSPSSRCCPTAGFASTSRGSGSHEPAAGAASPRRRADPGSSSLSVRP